MTDQGTATLGINATPPQIVDVIADFSQYKDWSGYIKSADILSYGDDGKPEDVHFVIDAGVVKADYTLRYSWAVDEHRAHVKWTLQSGTLKKNDGSYDIRMTDNASEVVYTLAVDMGVPMLGMLRRKVEKVIMDTALTQLKRRVEKT